MADLARHVHIRQKVHLDLDRAVAGAVLAAAALDVEREPPRLVSAYLGLRRLGEKPAYVIEDPGVGGRVGPRCTPDRRLIDMNDLVDLIGSGDRPVPAWHLTRVIDPFRESVVQDVVDERGLSGSGHSSDGDELAKRE